MQRRKANAEHGGLWEFPGGKVEHGETLKAAAVREIEEELGISLAIDDLRFVAEARNADDASPGATDQGRLLTISLYAVRNWNGVARLHEADELSWFVPATLGVLSMPPLDYPLAHALNRYLDAHSWSAK